MTIICSVATEFVSPTGERYKIEKRDLNLILPNAPEWIKDTYMFKLLEKDGSIKFVTSSNKKQLENDPTADLAADGKAIVEETETEPVKEPEAPKPTRKRKAKAE